MSQIIRAIRLCNERRKEMYNTKYMDEQFVDEFKGLAEKLHFSNGKLEAKEYVDAIVLPFLNGRGGY